MAEDLRGLVFQVGPAEDSANWGWMGLVATGRGLRHLCLPAPSELEVIANIRRQYPELALAPADTFLLDVAEQVSRYLRGASVEFRVDLDLRGRTAFELTVWSITTHIPYGQTRTYGWIAGQIVGALAQPVGGALATNPVPLIVPCHRVVGADGLLHGFIGGLEMKSRLLALESHQLRLPLA